MKQPCPIVFILILAISCSYNTLAEEHTHRFSPARSGNGNNLNLIVGFKGGINFSQPLIMNRTDVIQGYDPASPAEKDYLGLLANRGYQYGFIVIAYLRERLSLSFEPTMARYVYKYKTEMQWNSTTVDGEYVEFRADHKNAISYLEFPMVLRYEYGNKSLVPFVSLGISYGLKLSATKSMDSDVTRYTGSVAIPYESSSVISDNTSTYIRSRFILAPGVGVYYQLGPVKLMLSADLGLGFNNIIDESQRYGNPSVTSGMYDVQDDMRLATLNINFGVLFNTGTNQAGKAVECVTFKRKR